MSHAINLPDDANTTHAVKRELLWPAGAPQATGDDPAADMPALTHYAPTPERANGTSVIICPGGGYSGLSMGHEGCDIAHWFNGLGITAFVLEYRMRRGGYGHPIPLLDAQRAIRTVRTRAAALQLDAARIGILGFSAGGHLASTAGTHFDAGTPASADPIERVSSRPDFMILCYPVIAFDEPHTHYGSQHSLVGKEAEAALITSLSNEKQVTADTPPTFLFHTDQDDCVPAENSVAFYLALRQAGVQAELHVYRDGCHGVGLGKEINGTGEWSRTCEHWLRGRGLLAPAAQEKTPA